MYLSRRSIRHSQHLPLHGTLSLVCSCDATAPGSRVMCAAACHRGPSALDHLAAQLTVSLMSLADTGASEAAAAVGDKAADAVASGAAAVQGATDAAAAAVQRDNGWFGFFTGPFESVLKVRHACRLPSVPERFLQALL